MILDMLPFCHIASMKVLVFFPHFTSFEENWCFYLPIKYSVLPRASALMLFVDQQNGCVYFILSSVEFSLNL